MVIKLKQDLDKKNNLIMLLKSITSPFEVQISL